ncbi:hypothetical protein BDZ91DRAFT_296319 [Kalaharituber pfeilii]|nr:hypothetical protein BDZ91DRAFT_296319 [Kalaharituber pfeilii]
MSDQAPPAPNYRHFPFLHFYLLSRWDGGSVGIESTLSAAWFPAIRWARQRLYVKPLPGEGRRQMLPNSQTIVDIKSTMFICVNFVACVYILPSFLLGCFSFISLPSTVKKLLLDAR